MENNNAKELISAFDGSKLIVETSEPENSPTKINPKSNERLKYKNMSMAQMMKIIMTQASAIEASKPLIFENLSLQDTIALTMWETDNDFLLHRINIAENIVVTGRRFIGFRKNQFGTGFIPFTAQTTGNVYFDPLYSFINKLEYIANSYEIGQKKYRLFENYNFIYSSGRYEFTRYAYELDKKGNIPDNAKIISNDQLPEQYQLRAIDENGKLAPVEYILKKDIDGVLMLNRASGAPDIENIELLAHDRGKVLYELGSKIHKLSPKVLVKETIAGKSLTNDIEQQFEDSTFIKLTTRASQFQSPIAIFDPTRGIQDLKSLIDMYEDEILWAALCNSPMGSGKKAQENDLGTSLNNQTAGDYAEQKKNIRSIQYTQYFKKLAKAMGIDATDLNVVVELSTTQTRVIGNQDDVAPNADEEITFGGNE